MESSVLLSLNASCFVCFEREELGSRFCDYVWLRVACVLVRWWVQVSVICDMIKFECLLVTSLGFVVVNMF